MTGVFLTGGSGVVGGAVVRRLVADGRRVRALARSDDAAARVESLAAEPVRGDILDQDSLAAGMRGCEVVYHIAGANALCPEDPGSLFETNIDGTGNVVDAAARAGVRRIVHTSSAAALGEARGSLGTEESKHRGWYLSHYERSKHYSERIALASGARAGVEVVSVNPASVQGPGRSSGTTRILAAYLTGRLPVFVDTRLSFVDIDDCAEGHVQAEARGTPGERYVLCGGTLTTAEAMLEAERLAGPSRRPLILPRPLIYGIAAGMEASARLRGTHPPLCLAMARTVCFGHAYDGSRASRQLGLRYTPLHDTLRRTIEWLRSAG